LLDDEVTRRILHRLGRPRAASDTSPISVLPEQIVGINQRIALLEEDHVARRITSSERVVGQRAAEEPLQAAHHQLAAAGAVALRTVPVGDPAGLESWWRRLDMADRREVITTLIRKLTVAPSNPGNGSPMMVTTSSGINCLLVDDGLDNPVALLTDASSKSFIADYDPWGVQTLAYNSGGNGAARTPYVFHQGIKDPGSGLIKFGVRWYDPHHRHLDPTRHPRQSAGSRQRQPLRLRRRRPHQRD
jgi:hypothetical protein